MPADAAEAERVYRRWDSLNGRYYFIADVALTDGSLLRDVVFDSDTNVAVQVNPEVYGATISEWLVTRDRTGSTASSAEREAFAASRRVD